MRTKRAVTLGSFAAGAILLAVQPVSAQLVYEPFSYGSAAVGTNLANLTGSPTFAGYVNPMSGTTWFDTNTSTAVAEEVTLAGSSLAMPSGFYPAVGGSGQINNASPPSGHTARLAIAPFGFTSGTIYYSMAFQVTDLGAITATGGFFAGFNNTPGTQATNPSVVGARLQLRLDPNDATKFNVGIRPNSGSIAPAFDATPFAVGDTVFVVGAYTINPSTADDVSSLWVNPSSSTFGAGTAPATLLSVVGGSDPAGGISTFIVRQGNNQAPKAAIVDELRIDTTWAQVTPPSDHVWNGSVNTDWSDSGNWTGSEANGAGQFAVFGAGAGGFVSASASPKTLGSIIFQNTNSYSLFGQITFDGGAGGTSSINVLPVMDSTGPGTILPSSHELDGSFTLASNLTIDIGANQTFDLHGDIAASSASITKNGAGELQLQGSNGYSGGTVINNGTLAISGYASLGAPAGSVLFNGGNMKMLFSVIDAHDFTLARAAIIDTNGTNSGMLGTMTGSAALTKVGAGELQLQHMRTGTVNINAGSVRIGSSGQDSSVSVVSALNIAGSTDNWSTKLDLENNHAVIDYTTTSPLDTVLNQIKSGYNGGAWGGNGIDSSAAAFTASSAVKTALGYGEASVILGPSGGTWHGQTVDGSAVLVSYTLFGDATFDYTVDTVDFNILASNFSATGKHWTDGDFNYDGAVDTIDFNLLASNFSQTLAGASASSGLNGALVPEPASISSLGMVLGALAARRRRGSQIGNA